MRTLNVVLREALCEPCNNGWLGGELEERASSILKPMAVQRKPTVLHPDMSERMTLLVVQDGGTVELPHSKHEGVLVPVPDSRASLVGMADPFSSDAFYGSARDFALSALEAHHAGKDRRVPLDAGTALEHLAKACLAERPPALLAELRGDSGINSVMGLLRIRGAAVPAAKIRTVGLTEALARAGRFVRSRADKDDLQLLIDMRNGVVHAATETEVEERILAAFTQQADALLNELGRNRGDFWGGQL